MTNWRAPRVTNSPRHMNAMTDVFGSIPVFLYAPRASHVRHFDGSMSLTGDGMPNSKWTSILEGTYTLLFGLKIDFCPPDPHLGYVFGHTGVGG